MSSLNFISRAAGPRVPASCYAGLRAAARALLTPWLPLVLLLLFGLGLGRAAAQTPRLDVPFVPTPQSVVDRMLELADVKKGEKLYDLGSGDGRIVITAAKQYGARGVGIDLDPVRVREARDNAQKAGVAKQVEFIAGDLFKADLSDADVVTLYLLTSVNRDLRPQLWKQLKVGTRVVSHAFDMGSEWPPERTESVDGRTIHFWTVTEANKRAAERVATARAKQ
ncbi:MAG TPA: methyltransferase domain-containing protein [Duganella sp.]|jgi:SAM-dependent methyltransferase